MKVEAGWGTSSVLMESECQYSFVAGGETMTSEKRKEGREKRLTKE
jgi:hypothetical protein